jgi:hypothetical protein
MAFLRKCLQEARRRSGDVDGWRELTESTFALKNSSDDFQREQAWYPMSMAYRCSRPAYEPMAKAAHDAMPDHNEAQKKPMETIRPAAWARKAVAASTRKLSR